MTSATVLRSARRRAGLTQAELAARVGTTQSAIARWERAASAPSLERLTELVRACGLELDVALAPAIAREELATLRRNLSRSLDERLDHAVAAQRFVAAGRAAAGRRRRG